MIEAQAAPIPCTFHASDIEDDAELFCVGIGRTRKAAISDYVERCLATDPGYTNESPEFTEYLKGI